MKEVTLTKKRVFEIHNEMEKNRDKGNTFFKYFLSKNLKALKEEVLPIDDLQKEAKKKLIKYDEDIQSIINEYGLKDENGQFVSTPNGGVSIDPRYVEEAVEKKNTIEEEHKEILDEYQSTMNDINKLLDEETTLQLRAVKLVHIPDSVSSVLMDILVENDMIIEE